MRILCSGGFNGGRCDQSLWGVSGGELLMILELADLIAIWAPMGGLAWALYSHETRITRLEAESRASKGEPRDV